MYKYLYENMAKLDFDASIHLLKYSVNSPTISHNHDHYEMFLMTKGKIIQHINGESIEMTEGMLYFIIPEDTHYFVKNIDIPYAEWYNISISEPLILKLVNSLKKTIPITGFESFKKLIQLSPFQINFIINKLNFFMDLTYTLKDIKLAVYENFIEDMLLHFYANNYQDIYSNLPNWLEVALKEFVINDYYIEGIKKLVELSDKTQEHVTRSFQKHLSVSPTEFINNLRLNKAAFMLTSTSKSVLEISFDCGFDNISYFNRLFKAKYNLNPNSYRKTIHTAI